MAIGVVWVVVNLAVLSLIFGYPKDSGICTEKTGSKTSGCEPVKSYGWPKSVASSLNGEPVRFHTRNIPQNALVAALFLAPWLSVALLTGIGFGKYANHRN